ncbi:MAG: aspartate kinase [Pseudonocardia sp.]|nr:aspartate kinase [Pseudonocardia sp.]
MSTPCDQLPERAQDPERVTLCSHDARAQRWRPTGAPAGTVVRKYGGSSLASLEDVRRVAQSVEECHRTGAPTVVVVSARGDTTDELLDTVEQACPNRIADAAREIDQLLATGENASAALLTLVLIERGLPAVSLTGPQAGCRAAGRYRRGVIERVLPTRVQNLLDEGNIVVVAGFQAANADGDIVTLGRGGSDTTAVALAAALGARCEIYTDVAGICSADPRIVPDARVLPVIDAGLMAEMAFAGARVLHSRAIELAAMAEVEVRVASSYPRTDGTAIAHGSNTPAMENLGVVVAVTHDLDVARVLVRADTTDDRVDPASTVLSALAARCVPADLIARSGLHEQEFRMGFTIRRSDVDEVRTAVRRTLLGPGASVHIDENVGKVSLAGMGLLNRPEHTAQMLAALSSAGIPISWVSTSQLRASVVVSRDRTLEAVQLLHRAFGLAAHSSIPRPRPDHGQA